VVDATEEPEVALLVTLGTITGEVHPREALPVGLLVPLRVAVDPAEHGRPRSLQDEIAATPERHRRTVAVDDVGRDARERERGGTRFRDGHAGEWRDQDLAGLGLPPGVHDRRSVAADVLPVPQPR